MKLLNNTLALYLVTARYDWKEEDFLKKVEEACRSGVTLVQLREKECSTREYYELAKKVKTITDMYQIPLIINDRVDICLAVDASGVHIGADELPVDVVRNMIGNDKILGVTAKTVERALEAEKHGADYLGVGAIYPTTTKVITQPTSIETLRKIATTVSIPIVAIGGIKEDNMEPLKGTGIAGVAIVSEIMKADNIQEKCQSLRKKVTEILGGEVND
ncbi:thiamine phosphate synthase [uncultured Granulicatella sp.]|uniref:thiamine phosphate synthase n=1 Tax=uncultured Granulicatella sp. TaxID=316089 RepID=UPI0028EAFDD4|nr:thiamine phosphate synthase [uncultured Granulicatella sp.]